MKDMNMNCEHSSGQLSGMEAKHARKVDGSFYHNVKARNLLKKGGKHANVDTGTNVRPY